MAVLVAGLTIFPEPFVLVLDDYHTIQSAAVHEAVSFLLDNIPARMHLIMLTRTEPELPRARQSVSFPLDHEQRWYRYHHLFAQSLRKKLQHRLADSSEPVSLAELHVRASAWYEDNGMAMEAFRCAVAANRQELAARLAEGDGLFLHLRGEVAPVLHWQHWVTSVPEW